MTQMSVQLFDTTAAIVNVSSHEPGIPSDIIIESSANATFRIYYDTIFSEAIPIIINGVCNEDNYNKYLGAPP